jgi:anti-anti-sigma factor
MIFAFSDSKSTSPALDTDATSPPPAWENHSARFTAEWDASSVVITAHGELDASNANQLADYVKRCVARSTSVIVLDLGDLEFFGTAGFSALHLINVRCAGANLRWALVPGAAVSRLLRICDPDNTLPLVNSVGAMTRADDENLDSNPLFQLIPQPR